MSTLHGCSRWARISLPLAALLSLPLALTAQQPWEGRAFAGRPADIATAARAAVGPKDTDVVVLLEEAQFVFDASGRSVVTSRSVYRIGTEPPEDWSVAAALWLPWRQQRPVIRARVITADGREVQFDEKTIAEASLPTSSPDIFPDGRVLRAPLPAISAGAVVEVQTVTRDTQPLFDRGIAQYLPLGKLVPVLRTIVSVEVPSAMPLHHALQLLPNAMVSNSPSGRTKTLRIENGRLEALVPADFLFASAGNPRQPLVAFSTAASWSDVAAGYGAIVDSRIAPSNLAALVRETVGTATERNQIIDRVLQKVQRNIRYAAVELGVGSIVPRTPEETLKQEYGDCKDQAALLISMLRSAGIESYMALLSAGTGADVDPALPGFGAFDHAIVYVPGVEPVWIDSTTRFSRAGQLPPADQGRLALIIKPDTNSLVRIPESPSRSSIAEEIFLAENGRGRIVVTQEFFGTSELLLRSVQSQVKQADVEEALTTLYSAKAIRNLERTDPADFSVPYRMRFEAVNSESAQTSGGEAVYFLPSNDVLENSALAAVVDIEDELVTAGLDFGEVSVQERKYRIVPPPGYRRTTLPENSKITMGPATFTRTFSEAIDGTITGTVHLDSGKRRYSSQEIAELRAAVKKLGEDDYIRIAFEQTAQVLLDQGKTREALKEFRDLKELHPQEAVHHLEYGLALLQAGLGEQAKAEAKRAVELEPTSPQAHATLGHILEHDAIGRRWKPGFDHDKAKEAFEKALEIAPDDVTIRSNYAILLEFNRNGERFAPDLDLSPAIEQHRKIQDKLDARSTLRKNLPFALFWMKRYGELKAASVPADIRLAAIAASDGVATAIREAARLDSADRSSTLDSAASLLMQGRFYQEAAALSRASATGANAQRSFTLADQVERTRRYEELLTEKKEPATVAKEFFVRAVLGDRGEKLSPLLAKAGQQEVRATPDLRPDIALMPIAVLSRTGGLSVSPAAVDSALSALTIEVSGDDSTGYRVDFGRPLAGSGPIRSSQYLYVVLEDGEYRVLTAGRRDFALAQGALRFLEAGNLVSARRWLDWAEEEAGVVQLDAESLNIEAFFKVWFNSVTKDRARMRLAAATILSTSTTGASSVLSILSEGRNTTTGLVRDGIRLAYGTALLTLGRLEESLTVGQQLLQADPESRAIFLVADCMLRLNRVDALDKLLQQAITKAGDVREVTLLFAAVELKQGKVAQAEARLKSLSATGRDRADDRRALAWFNLYRDQVTSAHVTEAQQAMSARGLFDSAGMRVVAALNAEMGKTTEALSMLNQSMDAGAKREPDPDDWFVLGRIYEQYGEVSAAEAAYRKVIDRGPLPALDSATLLAQRRLNALRK